MSLSLSQGSDTTAGGLNCTWHCAALFYTNHACRSYIHSRWCSCRYPGRCREGFELFLHSGVSQAIGGCLDLANTFISLKQMGLVSSSLSTSFTTPIRPKQKKLRRKRPSSSWSSSSIIGGAAVVGLSALLIGVVYTSFLSSTSLPGMRQQWDSRLMHHSFDNRLGTFL